MPQKHWLYLTIRTWLVVVLLIACLGTTSSKISAKPVTYTYANGVQLAAGSSLPVFSITPPAITPSTTEGLAQSFSGIYDRLNPIPAKSDTFLKHPRQTIYKKLSETEGVILEQFSATGALFAYIPHRAFNDHVNSNISLDAALAMQMACKFIQNKAAVFPPSGDLMVPGVSDSTCDTTDFNQFPPYWTSTEMRFDEPKPAGLSVQAANVVTTGTPLRIMVTVPVKLKVGNFIPGASPIPLGGPGGHISMIFDDTSPRSTTPSLDNTLVGLQALAMPIYGLSFTHLKNIPAVDPASVKASVRALVEQAYPDATSISVPDPALEYYLGEAGEPRTILEPDLEFSGITVVENGKTIVLKNLILPGTEGGAGGLGPSLAISMPTNGQSYRPDVPVNLQATVSNGTPPYTYDWQLDDGSSLLSAPGTLASAGTLPLISKTIPAPESKGLPGSQNLHLIVSDHDGITRKASVSLRSPVWIYLPSLQKGKISLTPTAPGRADPINQKPAEADVPPSNYSFGIEYGLDYPPLGPGGSDLANTGYDANGFSNKLIEMGWSRKFKWYDANSWEKDWRDCSLGGSDCFQGVDRVDFAYFSGHGSGGYINVPSNNHDSSWVSGTDARFENIRWAAFSSCLTLRAEGSAGYEPIRDWFKAFQGAHMLLGFNSVMWDVDFGPYLIDNMRMPTDPVVGELPYAQRTIAEAWVQTAFQGGVGSPAYLYVTSQQVNPVGNKLPKPQDAPLPRPFPVTWYYWVYWTIQK